jgi:hypothetical protein
VSKIEYEYDYTWTIKPIEVVYTPHGIIYHNAPLSLGNNSLRMGISPHQETVTIEPDPVEGEYYMIMSGILYEVIRVKNVHHNHVCTVERGMLGTLPAPFMAYTSIYPIDIKWTRRAIHAEETAA